MLEVRTPSRRLWKANTKAKKSDNAGGMGKPNRGPKFRKEAGGQSPWLGARPTASLRRSFKKPMHIVLGWISCSVVTMVILFTLLVTI